MHFWHEDIEIDTEEELHDHRYDFKSTPIRGSITNELFSFLPDTSGEYYNHAVSCSKLIHLDEEPVRGSITKLGSFLTNKGASYTITSNVFHRATTTKNAVTLLERAEVIHEYAHVVTTTPTNPPCLFTTPYSQSQMWEMMEHCLDYNIGYHIDEIPKGVVGESSKILEETLELLDAERQSSIMAHVELSDLYGAIAAYAKSHGTTISDVAAMSKITERAFKNGRR